VFAANKVAGVRACLIHENFSAHQGVEDDDLRRPLPGRPRGRPRGCVGAGANLSRRALQRRATPSAPSGEGCGAGKQGDEIMKNNPLRQLPHSASPSGWISSGEI